MRDKLVTGVQTCALPISCPGLDLHVQTRTSRRGTPGSGGERTPELGPASPAVSATPYGRHGPEDGSETWGFLAQPHPQVCDRPMSKAAGMKMVADSTRRGLGKNP